MIRTLLAAGALLVLISCNPRLANGLRKNDLKKDVAIVTNYGTIVIRLSDSTPLHRDNFLRLVKAGYYDSLTFHRVIHNFMIQTGDPGSKYGHPGKPMSQGGTGGPAYTIPAEFRPYLFNKRGAIGSARSNDDVNPTRASSASQFTIMQGKKLTDAALDSTEIRLGRKIPPDQREVYKEIGGVPRLDQLYSVFGEVVRGMNVVDSIAAVKTSGPPLDRPIVDVRIQRMKLIRRSK